MIHLWLMIRKDFLYARSRLAAWYAVLAAKTLIVLWLMWGGVVSPDIVDVLRPIAIVLFTLETALAYLITALIVQQDPPGSPDAFWRTRPFSGGRLLLAKLASVTVLLVLPVPLIALPAWLLAGGGPSDLLDSALLQVLMQVLILLPAAVMAVFTSGVGGFVFGTLIGYVLLPLLLGIAVGELGSAVRTAPRLLLGLKVGATGACVLAALSYLTRRRGLCWLAGAGASALALWFFSLPPGQPRAADESAPLSFRPLATAKIQLEFDAMRPAVPRGGSGTEEGLRPLLRVTGIPAEIALRVSADEQQLRWADRVDTWRSVAWMPLPLSLEVRAVRAALGFPPEAPGLGVLPLTLSLPPTAGAVARPGVDLLAYGLTARLALLQPDVSLVQPLSGHGWQAARGRGIRIIDVESAPSGAQRIRTLNSELLVSSSTLRGHGAQTDPRVGLVSPFLVSGRNDRLLALTHHEDSMLIMAGLRFATFTLRASGVPEVRGREGGVSLVWVTWEELATIRRQLLVGRPVLELGR